MSDASEPGDQSHDPVGSLGEEALKLFGAFSDWATSHGADLGRGAEFAGQFCEGVRNTAREGEEHFATGAAECKVCPVCRTVHAVREVSPEVKAHLRSAGTSLLHAVSGLLAAVTVDHPPAPGKSRASDGVEHIDLDADPDGDGQ